MKDRLERCFWCGRKQQPASDWEQQHYRTGTWHRLCRSCAKRRLNNPWNALLDLRKIA